ncbi:MAG: hypothetical protein WC222_02905 [Parachlamydiales bacterium]|jgi:hypothetical protein
MGMLIASVDNLYSVKEEVNTIVRTSNVLFSMFKSKNEIPILLQAIDIILRDKRDGLENLPSEVKEKIKPLQQIYETIASNQNCIKVFDRCLSVEKQFLKDANRLDERLCDYVNGIIWKKDCSEIDERYKLIKSSGISHYLSLDDFLESAIINTNTHTIIEILEFIKSLGIFSPDYLYGIIGREALTSRGDPNKFNVCNLEALQNSMAIINKISRLIPNFNKSHLKMLTDHTLCGQAYFEEQRYLLAYNDQFLDHLPLDQKEKMSKPDPLGRFLCSKKRFEEVVKNT